MSLKKAIEHGKEHRKPRIHARMCSPHGACGYCARNRIHNNRKRALTANDTLEEIKTLFEPFTPEKEEILLQELEGFGMYKDNELYNKDWLRDLREEWDDRLVRLFS